MKLAKRQPTAVHFNLIYSFRRKFAFGAFMFWCMASERTLHGVVFRRSGSIWEVESCKSSIPGDTPYSVVQTFLL